MSRVWDGESSAGSSADSPRPSAGDLHCLPTPLSTLYLSFPVLHRQAQYKPPAQLRAGGRPVSSLVPIAFHAPSGGFGVSGHDHQPVHQGLSHLERYPDP